MLSPETMRLMMQTYEEWMQHDPLARSRPLETMKWAYQQICAGKDPWTGLGSFSHAWYGWAKSKRADLVREPLAKPERETEYTRRWAAFCAASVEFLCDRYGVPCPEWVHDPYYILPHPWSGSNVFPKITSHDLKTTPPPFVKRNIFCGARLFQNKYEMYEWMKEAVDKGLTDPGEIWRYARDKEISTHGA